MELIIAITLAIIFGGLQFFLLLKAVRSIANGKRNIFYFIAQFFCPILGLGLCVWIAKRFLILCAIIICVILFAGAIFYNKMQAR